MTDTDTLAHDWKIICDTLQTQIGKTVFNNWIKPLEIQELEEDELKIAAPTNFIKNWVSSHYLDKIKMLWQSKNPEIRVIDLVVNSAANKNYVAKNEAILNEKATARTQITAKINDSTDVIAALDPRFTFDNFVVGKPNELAHAAARRVTDVAEVTFNPLFLYGGVGLGKTHLMHAIAWQIHKNTPERRVLYLSAEKFMYQFIRSIRFKDTMSFKEQFRSVDVLMIDDVQFIGGKDSTQEEFFHTFNALVDQNRQVIISADKSPSDLEGMEERLRSRLGWGLVADIHPTTYELRLSILQSKADALDCKFSPKVLEFLAHRITSSVRELEGALNRIVAHSQLVGREITLETTQDVLKDLLRSNDKRVTIEDIQKKVAEHYTVRMSDMSSTRRSISVTRPRQIAMYLIKHLTPHSLPEIGKKFGGRDHTTVMHAIKKIEELSKTDKSLCEDLDLLQRMLTS